MGIGIARDCKPITTTELVCWDASIVRDGVRGGSRGAFLRRFDRREDNTSCDKLIDKVFTKTRWLETKRCIKLNCNLAAPKRGDPDCDPAHKCNFIFKVVFHNVNALTRKACNDQCVD